MNTLETKSQSELRRMKDHGVDCPQRVKCLWPDCQSIGCSRDGVRPRVLTRDEKLAVVEELNRRFEHTITGWHRNGSDYVHPSARLLETL